MKHKIAHIESVNGIPLCRQGMVCESEKITCSYYSIQAAKRTVKRLQKHGHRVKVVIGACPSSY